MDQEELDKILTLHRKWIGGEQADLRHADLRGACLSWADLTHVKLGGADLRGADLRGADLRYTYLAHANLTDAKIDYQIQEGLLEQIKEVVLADESKLDMGDWHRPCGTTHCLAGWACHLNPVAKGLEGSHGSEIAGLLTLGAEAHSYFFKTGSEVINWLKEK